MDCQGKKYLCANGCECGMNERKKESHTDFKCNAGCKCPLSQERKKDVVLENILSEMLNMSGISKQSKKDPECVDKRKEKNPERMRPEIMDYPFEDDSLIYHTCPPAQFFHGERANDRKEREAEAINKFMQAGIKRNGKGITNLEEHQEAAKKYDPEKSRKAIDKNLKKIAEFQENYPKSPAARVDLWETPPLNFSNFSWTDYINQIDATSYLGLTNVEEAKTDANQNRNKKKLPPQQKVYPPERYLT